MRKHWGIRDILPLLCCSKRLFSMTLPCHSASFAGTIALLAFTFLFFETSLRGFLGPPRSPLALPFSGLSWSSRFLERLFRPHNPEGPFCSPFRRDTTFCFSFS